jgi:PIN domain nuclease of toxin-antitoxin system
MKILLDTHILLWFLTGDEKLLTKERQVIEDTVNTVWVSIASLWEIAIKHDLGKLHLKYGVIGLLNQVEKNGIKILPIEPAHILKLSGLQQIHRDPFDRIIIAQSLQEDLVIISHDEFIAQYPVIKYK